MSKVSSRSIPLPNRPGRAFRAKPSARYLARLIDTSLLVLGALLVGLVVSAVLRAFGVSDHQAGFVGTVSTAAFVLGGWVTNMTWLVRSGQTLGKRLMKIELVTTKGTRVGFENAVLVREALVPLLGLVPVVGPLFGLVDGLMILRAERRCLHDYMAGTEVVSLRNIVAESVEHVFE